MANHTNDGLQISRSVACGFLSLQSHNETSFQRAYALRELAANSTGYPKYLLAYEISVLLASIHDLQKRMLFDFIWNTGARINEALAVTPEDIVFDAIKPFVILHTLKQRNCPTVGRPPKRHPVKRAIPLLDPSFIERLKDHIASFCKFKSKPIWVITDDTARNWLHEGLSQCGNKGVHFSIKSITPKTLRHSFAMHLAMHGASPATIQAYLGHRDFKSTQHYLKIFTLDLSGELDSGLKFSYPVNLELLQRQK